MEKSVNVGDVVAYYDPTARRFDALVTAVHGTGVYDPEKPGSAPSLNLVFVSVDPERSDTYGRQIERETSVVHQTVQQAHGFYWSEV